MPKAQSPPAENSWSPSANGIAVDPAWQDRMNDETIAQLMALQGELDRRSRAQMEALVASAAKTLVALKAMTWVVFAIGVFLLAFALALFATRGQSLDVFGIGALGIADFVSLFLFKPMEKLQSASADFAQQVVLLRAWSTSVILQLLAMDVRDRASVRESERGIRDAAVEMSKALQESVG